MKSNTAPLSFADISLRKNKITRTGALLEKAENIIDFSFTAVWHKKLHPSDRGRKPFDTGVMFRIILLQQ